MEDEEVEVLDEGSSSEVDEVEDSVGSPSPSTGAGEGLTCDSSTGDSGSGVGDACSGAGEGDAGAGEGDGSSSSTNGRVPEGAGEAEIAAESTGQGSRETDAGGNRKLLPVGPWFVGKVEAHFKAAGLPVAVKCACAGVGGVTQLRSLAPLSPPPHPLFPHNTAYELLQVVSGAGICV